MGTPRYEWFRAMNAASGETTEFTRETLTKVYAHAQSFRTLRDATIAEARTGRKSHMDFIRLCNSQALMLGTMLPLMPKANLGFLITIIGKIRKNPEMFETETMTDEDLEALEELLSCLFVLRKE